MVCLYEIVVSIVQFVVVFKVKVDKDSFNLVQLQQVFWGVNQVIVGVVVLIIFGKLQIEEIDNMDFLSMMLIQIKC